MKLELDPTGLKWAITAVLVFVVVVALFAYAPYIAISLLLIGILLLFVGAGAAVFYVLGKEYAEEKARNAKRN